MQKPAEAPPQPFRDPAGHRAHAVHVASVGAVEYLPAPHAVQAVAPADAPVFVIEPAVQVLQNVLALFA